MGIPAVRRGGPAGWLGRARVGPVVRRRLRVRLVLGLGVGLLPRLAPLRGAEHVVRLRIAGKGKPARRIVAAVRRGSLASPLIQESLGILTVSSNRILAARPEDDL